MKTMSKCPKTFNFVKLKVIGCDHHFETAVIILRKLKFSNIREDFGRSDWPNDQ